VKLTTRLRWMFTRCGYCKRRLLLAPFIVIAKNPRKSWAAVAIHEGECRPTFVFRGAP